MTQKAALTVDKTSTTKSVTTVGQIVNYSFLVTNTGNVDLNNISVVDTQAVPSLNSSLSPITCPSTTLAAGASMTCTATYTVTQADLNSGFVDDSAVGIGTPSTTGGGGQPPPPITSSPSMAALPTSLPPVAVVATVSPVTPTQVSVTAEHARSGQGDHTDLAVTSVVALNSDLVHRARSCSGRTLRRIGAWFGHRSGAGSGGSRCAVRGCPAGGMRGSHSLEPPDDENDGTSGQLADAVPSVPNGSTLLANFHANTPSSAGPGEAPSGPVPASWHNADSVLPVIASHDNWVEVRLAQRPNESTAWVQASEVTFSSTPYRIVVDLATTHLQLYKSNTLMMSAPIRDWHTPVADADWQFFRRVLAQPSSAGYAPFVMVTSAHSNTITDWKRATL